MTKNYNLKGFKELQYVDLQYDLQRTTTWKVVKYFSIIEICSQNYHNFILICTWFVGLLHFALFIWTSSNLTSIVLITYAVIFSKQEVSRRRVVHGSAEEYKCLWNSRKTVKLKSNCKLNFFSKYFVLNNQENIILLKNSEKKVDTSFKKLLLFYWKCYISWEIYKFPTFNINYLKLKFSNQLLQSQFILANILVSLDCLNFLRIFNFVDIF